MKVTMYSVLPLPRTSSKAPFPQMWVSLSLSSLTQSVAVVLKELFKLVVPQQSLCCCYCMHGSIPCCCCLFPLSLPGFMTKGSYISGTPGKKRLFRCSSSYQESRRWILFHHRNAFIFVAYERYWTEGTVAIIVGCISRTCAMSQLCECNRWRERKRESHCPARTVIVRGKISNHH